MVLALCTYLINISLKFHEDILNGFQVTKQTRFLWLTDRRTDDHGRNDMSPDPEVWRHKTKPLNTKNTPNLVFTTIPYTSFGDTPINSVSSQKLLGLYIDETLSWNPHIENFTPDIIVTLCSRKYTENVLPKLHPTYDRLRFQFLGFHIEYENWKS